MARAYHKELKGNSDFRKNMVKISVVVLNWNRKNDTLECVESLGKLKLNDIKLLITVVDNNSTDDSRFAIKKRLKIISRNRKNVSYTLIKNRQNLGFAGGNNVGIRFSLSRGSDYVLLLNNDTIVDPELIHDLLQVVKLYPKGGMFTPKIYFARGFEFHKDRYKDSDLGNVIWSAGGDLDWDNVYGTNHGVDKVDVGQFDSAGLTDFATGACVLIKSQAIKNVGMFDENFFLYFEDVDLSMRMKRAGWEIIYSPPGHIWHKVSQSSGIGSNLNDYFITRNRLLFGMRYASLRTRFALYKESLRLLINGRKWQKKGVLDFYFGKFGKGSWVSAHKD